MPTLTSVFGSIVLVLLTSGCGYMAPVRVDATPSDLEVLTGQWHGEYASPALGRRGTIDFRLTAGQTTAKGVIAMVPQNAVKPYEPSTLGQPLNVQESHMLTIQFVRAASGELDGQLDPYWDPDRNCQANTRFTGHLTTDTMEGTFTTTRDCGPGQASGHWRVTRKDGKAKPSRDQGGDRVN